MRVYVTASTIIYQSIKQKKYVAIFFFSCFLIGNILDAIDDRSGYLTEQLTILQKNIKYGVSSAFQIFICENIFDDRRLLPSSQMINLGKRFAPDETFQDCIVANRQRNLSILKDYPEYFSHKLRVINRRCADPPCASKNDPHPLVVDDKGTGGIFRGREAQRNGASTRIFRCLHLKQALLIPY